jgi:GTPase
MGNKKAILVSVFLSKDDKADKEISLEELKSLSTTFGLIPDKVFVQNRNKVQPATFIGSGKVTEIKNYILETQIEFVLFDNELSPAQLSNLEKILDARVIDRTSLIIEIFAQRAKTNEAKLQVELAQLNYELPRLKRRWTHFSKQIGVIGVKGPGEKQIELDRRQILKRISVLKNKLKQVKKNRFIQKQNRKDFISLALIGYTNSGKSTLLKSITKGDVFIENKLFATLDAKTSRLTHLFKQNIMITDTVGFIKNLPHQLIDAFKSTLEEVVTADILINVVDISKDSYKRDIDAVYDVLKELKVKDKPIITVLNKIDKAPKKYLMKKAYKQHPNAVLISARNRLNLYSLITKIDDLVQNFSKKN